MLQCINFDSCFTLKNYSKYYCFISKLWLTLGPVDILAWVVAILLHFLSCSLTVSIGDGVKLWLITPWLHLLCTSHMKAVTMVLKARQRQEQGGRKHSGERWHPPNLAPPPIGWLLFTAQRWQHGSFPGSFVTSKNRTALVDRVGVSEPAMFLHGWEVEKEKEERTCE